MKNNRSRIPQFFLNSLVHSKLINVIPYALQNSLTVLNYHRIDDPYRDGFDTLRINVSATPLEFEKQMDFIRKHFNVISCEYLASCLRGENRLPPRAAIITFDDGYYDNLSNAYPILKARDMPAVIFLATDFIENKSPFYWDYVAYAFSHTKKDQAELPVIGPRHWPDATTRENVLLEWIEAVKRISEREKKKAVGQIDASLGVSIPDDAFSNLHLTWDQVRQLRSGGIEFGAHTASHPILTRIPLEQAENEVLNSKKVIEDETGGQVISFAYPNGGAADFSSDIIRIVGKAGIEVAFSLLSGPTFYKTVKSQPLAIRRIFLSYRDSYPRFVIKVVGVARLMEAFRR
jgi:peptidoglycan/xylan/chitin deacetylase (PgdA/CDA1 family)